MATREVTLVVTVIADNAINDADVEFDVRTGIEDIAGSGAVKDIGILTDNQIEALADVE